MISHLYCLSIVHAVRGLAGIGVAVLFLYYSNPMNVPVERSDLTMSRFHSLEAGDVEAFRVVGIVLVALALIRLGFAVSTLMSLWRARDPLTAGKRTFRFVRRYGLAVAMVDIVALTLFPVTTACGLYGWLVFRHADTRDFFEGKLASV